MRTITPEECAERIRKSSRIVALSGAGVSTAAGIPDFRGPNGLYTTGNYDPETVFDIRHFLRSPTEFFQFSRDMLKIVKELKPTFTHEFFSRLETDGKLQAMITQNIDAFHQTAGSKRVIAVHGSYATGHCLACGKEYDYDFLEQQIVERLIPYCDCREEGVVKPDVVFFGEAVKGLDEAYKVTQNADLFFVLGSSLAVWPAAGIPQLAPCDVIVVNKGEVDLSAPNAYSVQEDLDEFFKAVDAAL